jgi:hypothetical protein
MSAEDTEELNRLRKELAPIEKFLNEARQQREAILREIGYLIFYPDLFFYLIFS